MARTKQSNKAVTIEKNKPQRVINVGFNGQYTDGGLNFGGGSKKMVDNSYNYDDGMKMAGGNTHVS